MKRILALALLLSGAIVAQNYAASFTEINNRLMHILLELQQEEKNMTPNVLLQLRGLKNKLGFAPTFAPLEEQRKPYLKEILDDLAQLLAQHRENITHPESKKLAKQNRAEAKELLQFCND